MKRTYTFTLLLSALLNMTILTSEKRIVPASFTRNEARRVLQPRDLLEVVSLEVGLIKNNMRKVESTVLKNNKTIRELFFDIDLLNNRVDDQKYEIEFLRKEIKKAKRKTPSQKATNQLRKITAKKVKINQN